MKHRNAANISLLTTAHIESFCESKPSKQDRQTNLALGSVRFCRLFWRFLLKDIATVLSYSITAQIHILQMCVWGTLKSEKNMQILKSIQESNIHLLSIFLTAGQVWVGSQQGLESVPVSDQAYGRTTLQTGRQSITGHRRSLTHSTTAIQSP